MTITTARPGAVRGIAIALTALAPASWGLTYLVTTELLPPGRPLLAGTLRALPAGLLLLTTSRQRPVGAWWWKAALLGTLNIGAFFALLFVAAYRLPGGVAATLGSIQPLIAGGLATVVLHERMRRSILVAGALGIVGVGLLVMRAEARLDAVGVLAGLAGALSMATGVVLTKRWGRPAPLAAFTAWQLIAGGVVLVPLALIVEGAPPHLTVQNLLGFTWLATGGAAVAYQLWFRGIGKLPVAQVSLLGLLSPVVATLVGWLIAHQSLVPAQLLGGVLVMSALWVGQRPGRAVAVRAGTVPGEAGVVGEDRQLNPVGEVQLQQDPRHVRRDGRLAHEQHAADLSVGAPPLSVSTQSLRGSVCSR